MNHFEHKHPALKSTIKFRYLADGDMILQEGILTFTGPLSSVFVNQCRPLIAKECGVSEKSFCFQFQRRPLVDESVSFAQLNFGRDSVLEAHFTSIPSSSLSSSLCKPKEPKKEESKQESKQQQQQPESLLQTIVKRTDDNLLDNDQNSVALNTQDEEEQEQGPRPQIEDYLFPVEMYDSVLDVENVKQPECIVVNANLLTNINRPNHIFSRETGSTLTSVPSTLISSTSSSSTSLMSSSASTSSSVSTATSSSTSSLMSSSVSTLTTKLDVPTDLTNSIKQSELAPLTTAVFNENEYIKVTFPPMVIEQQEPGKATTDYIMSVELHIPNIDSQAKYSIDENTRKSILLSIPLRRCKFEPKSDKTTKIKKQQMVWFGTETCYLSMTTSESTQNVCLVYQDDESFTLLCAKSYRVSVSVPKDCLLLFRNQQTNQSNEQQQQRGVLVLQTRLIRPEKVQGSYLLGPSGAPTITSPELIHCALNSYYSPFTPARLVTDLPFRLSTEDFSSSPSSCSLATTAKDSREEMKQQQKPMIRRLYTNNKTTSSSSSNTRTSSHNLSARWRMTCFPITLMSEEPYSINFDQMGHSFELRFYPYRRDTDPFPVQLFLNHVNVLLYPQRYSIHDGAQYISFMVPNIRALLPKQPPYTISVVLHAGSSRYVEYENSIYFYKDISTREMKSMTTISSDEKIPTFLSFGNPSSSFSFDDKKKQQQETKDIVPRFLAVLMDYKVSELDEKQTGEVLQWTQWLFDGHFGVDLQGAVLLFREALLLGDLVPVLHDFMEHIEVFSQGKKWSSIQTKSFGRVLECVKLAKQKSGPPLQPQRRPMDLTYMTALFGVFQRVVYPKLLDEPTMTDLMDADSDNNLAFGPLSRSIPQQMAVRSAGDYKDYKVPKGPPTVLGLRGQFDNIPPPPSRPGEVVKKMDDMMKELLLQEARTNVIDEAYIKNNASRLMEEARKRLQKDVLPLATKAIEDQNAYRALLVRDHKPKITAWVSESKHGIHWPHGPDVRRKLELSGFEFAPTVLRRDRCECRTCKAEYHNYRSWDSLREKHKQDCPFYSRR